MYFNKSRAFLLIIILFVPSIISCSSCGGSTAPSNEFTLSSDDITNGYDVGLTFVCTDNAGLNLSPQLSWDENIPDGTLSFAITLIDQQASSFIHWIMYNVPVDTTSLSRGADAPTGAVQVANSGNYQEGYFGPCAPLGTTHAYHYKVWALDVADAATISGFDPSGNASFAESIADNVLGTSYISVNYTGE